MINLDGSSDSLQEQDNGGSEDHSGRGRTRASRGGGRTRASRGGGRTRASREEVQPEYLEEQVSVVVEVEPGDKDLRANHLSLKYLGKKLTQTQMRSHQYCHLPNLLVLYEAFLTIALLLSSTLL